MTKVITYGTYDFLHYGHIRLLERAKALGDYLIVGVTADDFDKKRGKINVRQSLMERIEAVRATGLADEIIIEEYEGQKIDDIKRYNVDIFTVGSDWEGKFDYLGEYCQVVYLQRTEGVSSSDIRSRKKEIRLGLVGESVIIHKVEKECQFVNGIKVVGLCAEDRNSELLKQAQYSCVTDDYDTLLEQVDAVYIVSVPSGHYRLIKAALEKGKHVLCESPVALSERQCRELFALAEERQCILMDFLKTAYSTAYHRLQLMLKGGCIGKVVSVDAVCTSLREVDVENKSRLKQTWNSICAWGPTAMLPIFQILGVDYQRYRMVSQFADEEKQFDLFTKIDFEYKHAVASVKVGKGVKSEGELIISGTNGYIYVPAPWWKTDYFEIRYENQENNKRYFYQLDGEGIRYELVIFMKSIEMGKSLSYVEQSVSESFSRIIEAFYNGEAVGIGD